MPLSTIRDAASGDVEVLCDLEASSFDGDRLSPRSIRRLIRSPSASCRVVEADRGIAGYAILLFRAGTSVARLYSIAVAAGMRGLGLATALVGDAERIAAARGAKRIRLEVREDNAGAIRLYDHLGFRRIGRRAGYYADGAAALRFEKQPGRRPVRDR